MLWRPAPPPLYSEQIGTLLTQLVFNIKNEKISKEELSKSSTNLISGLNDLREEGLPFTVVIGDVCHGGVGKTQVVQFLGRLFHKLGIENIFILSHGYLGKNKVPTALTTMCLETLLFKFGDEATMLHTDLPSSIQIISGGTWVDKWRYARDGGAQIIICDGGLYTSKLPRHLGIIVISSEQRNRLIPFGSLTRPKATWPRGPQYLFWGIRQRQNDQFDLPLDLVSWVKPDSFYHPKSSQQTEWQSLSRVSAICGLAHPYRFRISLDELGYQLDEFILLRDHQKIPRDQLEKIKHQSDKLWLTTRKDQVKLINPPHNLWALKVRLQIMD